MGQSAAETVAEIEQIRDRLDGEIHELQERMPAALVAGKRVAGIAAGGGVAGSLLWMMVRHRRKKKRAKKAFALRDGATFTAEIRLIPS